MLSIVERRLAATKQLALAHVIENPGCRITEAAASIVGADQVYTAAGGRVWQAFGELKDEGKIDLVGGGWRVAR